MIIKVMIVDEDNEIINDNVGKIDAKQLLEFIRYAEKYDAKCLQFIDITGDTLFSNKQMYQIRNELAALRHDSSINQNILDIVEQGITQGLLRDFDYLKFEGL